MSARSGFTWEDLQMIDQKWPNATVTSTGLRYVMLKEGQGAHPQAGETVSVLFRGWLFNGTKFDEMVDPKEPFHLRLARGEIIEGWEEGLSLMRRGGKMMLMVPAELAYGSRGRPPTIPRNSSLVFEIELLDIKPFVPPTGAAPAAAPKEGK